MLASGYKGRRLHFAFDLIWSHIYSSRRSKIDTKMLTYERDQFVGSVARVVKGLTDRVNKHRWFSGRMLACHAGGPGSIPGRRSVLFLFPKILLMESLLVL